MKKNQQSSIDGFIPRRPHSQMGQRHELGGHLGHPSQAPAIQRPELKSEEDLIRASNQLGKPVIDRSLNRSDIDESLREIDNNTPDAKKLSRRERKRLKRENRSKGQRLRRRIFKISLTLLVIILIAGGGWFVYRTLSASDHVLNGSIIDLIQREPLKVDANGRSNFLIVGTSEDDPGHEGADLTDSIMILSVDQKNKNAYTFSIPRDLYVNYDMACTSGYRGKINGYFSCVNSGTDETAEQDRLTKTQAFIGDILGLDIQYGVHVNYTVMRDVVNAIGGSIKVTIDSRDPRGVMDSNFDWKCGATYAKRLANCPPNGHFIDYPNGEVVLDAEHALYLAQARGDMAPTYGFEQSNFDRERNQQKILVAIREKALSSGTLSNIGAISGLIDALGNNLRTNIQIKEVRTLMDLAKDIPADKITPIDFYATDNPIFTTGDIAGAGSSVYPVKGLYDYSGLQTLLKKTLNSEPFMKEDPVVTVLNGSDTSGVAQKAADALTAKGFTVDSVTNAPEGTYSAVEIYQINTTKTLSAEKLKSIYNAVIKTTTPPISVTDDTDFVVIIGSAAAVK